MRELMHRTLTPIVERMHDDREALAKTERETGLFDERVQELEDHVFYWKREEALAALEAEKRAAREAATAVRRAARRAERTERLRELKEAYGSE